MEIKVFIPSGAGSPGFGGISECLGEAAGLKIYAGDVQERAYGKSLAKGFSVMPASDSSLYLAAVLENGNAFGCNVLLPITTRELSVFSENEGLLRNAGLALAISPEKSLAIANNKAKLYTFLRERNYLCAKFEITDNKAGLLSALKRLGSPKEPCIIKPAEGNGSRGFRIICAEAELQREYFDNKAGTVKTSWAALEAELPDNFPQTMVACEYLPGDEYSVDMLVNRGDVLAIAVRLREKTVSGISVRGTFVQDAEIEKQCRIIADSLDLHGPIGMQFKRDTSGVAKMLEINPRLQGAVSAARYVGINFPLLAVKLALGIPFDIPVQKFGVSFNRYWKDIQE